MNERLNICPFLMDCLSKVHADEMLWTRTVSSRPENYIFTGSLLFNSVDFERCGEYATGSKRIKVLEEIHRDKMVINALRHSSTFMKSLIRIYLMCDLQTKYMWQRWVLHVNVIVLIRHLSKSPRQLLKRCLKIKHQRFYNVLSTLRKRNLLGKK